MEIFNCSVNPTNQTIFDIGQIWYNTVNKSTWEYLGSGVWGTDDEPALATEYATRKKYLGSVVYKKRINIGTLPNNGATTTAHGITNISYKLNHSGQCVNGSGVGLTLPWSSPTDTNCIEFVFDNTNFTAFTTGNFSAYTGVGYVEYTKTS